jgi:hypothetical protein
LKVKAPIPDKQHIPYSNKWTLTHLQNHSIRSISILRKWSHSKRHREITRNTIQEICALDAREALKALNDLKKPHVYVRGTRGSKLEIQTQLIAADTRKEFTARALIDSGCVGSCIDIKFANKHDLNLTKLPRPIPVYNADGKPNAAGPISHMVTMELHINSHVEKVDFAVTDLGDGEVFLGHDWLKRHNPTVNWQDGLLVFNRCPPECLPILDIGSIDFDPKKVEYPHSQLTVERILMVDLQPVMNIRARGTISTELAHQATREVKKKSFNEQIPSYLHEFRDVFDKKDFDELPPKRPWDHAIELIPGKELRLDCKIYPLSRTEQEELDKFLEENLRTGRIRPSKSPMASPFFFIKKKDGSLRPVQDYHRLNEMTVKNRYPLPLISELMDDLQNAHYFTKLDVRWGYNNVRMKEGDEFKAAFRTNRGLFEPLVMFFGLTNSPATFQTMMNELFKDEVVKGHVRIYIDDILIFNRDLDEHHYLVRHVLQKLRDNRLFLKPEKCEFDKLETEYLGVLVSEGQIRMDPVKIEGVANWPRPTSKREVQSFLGFCNFYRRFIQDFAKIARPLNNLTGNVAFQWTDLHTISFNQLRTLITSAPIIMIPNNDDQFRLETDASDFAVGAVLSQKQNNTWKPVAFLSRSLTPTQRNYEIYDKELLAIMLALEEFRRYLIDAKHPFEIWTDHANLQYFKKPQNLNRRQARWLTEIQEFHFTLHHIPGKSNSKADLLSRRAGFDQGHDDNRDVILLSPNIFVNALKKAPTLPFLTSPYAERII